MKYCKTYILILLICLCFSACDRQQYVTNTYCTISDEGWSYFDTLNYSFNADDTNGEYNVYLNIIHNNEYKYRNLFLFTQLYLPDSTCICDTVQLVLCDPSGNLLGKGVGETKEAKFLISEDFTFQWTGNHELKIIQGMRDERIYGIEKIGFTISK